MWSHSPHHTYASCGEILDLSTSFIWRYLKILPMWRNIRFLHIYHAKKSEISPHDKFFSTCLAGDTSSTVKKMRKFYATKISSQTNFQHQLLLSLSSRHSASTSKQYPATYHQPNSTLHCQHGATPQIYWQYIGTTYKYIFLKYIGNISGTRCTRSALARKMIF